MSYFIPKEIPNCCGICPCFHAERLMYCQAVKADKNKRIYAPYEGYRPDWCPLIEIKTPHGRLGDLDALVKTLEQNRLCYVSDIDDESFELGTNRAIDAVRNADTIIEAED